MSELLMVSQPAALGPAVLRCEGGFAAEGNPASIGAHHTPPAPFMLSPEGMESAAPKYMFYGKC